ncbi:Eco57I restriction-modification methylase domain-containing protein [Actinopolyspora halophila]|uniref:Eco57I restriction-modification methylase domain-containing protein n=1 Tax=Actinopolyspora halophila TaxID=1850 RepID=UPI00036BD1A5|nr:type IIL restriction-modification enzyme MmeI [Actinopolyspora halophila]
MSRTSFRPKAPDVAEQHREWLDLIEVSGPFLSLPVLKRTWPNGLDALDKSVRQRLRREHTTWQADTVSGQRAWIDYVLGELLGWGEQLCREGLDALGLEVAEHDTVLEPSFALVEPGEEVKPEAVRLLGVVCEPGQRPTARVPGSAWAATPADRLAQLCRHHGVELGLVTDGRWWVLVRAPRSGVTTTAVFDAVPWPEAAERDVVRAFVSLLGRKRFFAVPEGERLPALLSDSEGSQEEITEALGVQVREAVELLVAAFGRASTRQRERGESELDAVAAHEVYRGAVSVMMRVVFLLFAEERRLLPSDNELYATTYSAGRLYAELEQRKLDSSEEDLEHSSTGWHRLLALFEAVYRGVSHPRLTMHPHDGSLFDPEAFPWLPLNIDDRTVLHVLRAVQHVQVGTGKSRERRTLSFRSLDVEQIGYVYEGLLSYDGFRAEDTTVGLVGKRGQEAEVPLRQLEELAAGSADADELAAALHGEFKDSGIGTARKLAKQLAPPEAVEREERRKKLLDVTRGDSALAERLLPFQGVIRDDLRELPVVVLPGELFVTESPLRANTGTHYTPRFLAEDVVRHALEPLVYEPGPLTTAEQREWKLKSSGEILKLKVADIAMGSAAFLVAAARYLGGKLLEAWIAEDDERVRDYRPTEYSGDGEEEPVVVEARRQVIEHCLYGADINPMAVEMAKLSLWLVSMDPQRPFTFLDDRLVAGDSLLGITSLEQLEYMHLDARKGRAIHERSPVDFTANVRSLVSEVAEQRRELREIDGTTLEGLHRKRALLAEANLKGRQAELAADLAVGAALAYAGKGEKDLRDGSIAAADYARRMEADEARAREQAREWLDTDLPEGNFRREALHWPLVFPEVFEQGGFDAVVGNPPFLGGLKLTGALGTAYREFLVHALGRGARGLADLVAYCELRAHAVLNESGQSGLIATNTLAQGDTREVGLDQLVDDGVTIRRAIKSAPWPSKSAALEYCAVWTSRAELGAQACRIADEAVVDGITPSLDVESRVTGNPERLAGNRGIGFIGSYVLGKGFIMRPDQAAAMVESDPRNDEVIFPYVNGDDLNSRPDCGASRWVINFFDWSEEQAKNYPDCYEKVLREVKPERDKVTHSKHARERWWRYERGRPELYQAIAGLDRVMVITLVSKTAMPVMVPTGQVFSHMLGVFATEDTAMLGLLSSAQHFWWAKTRSSTLETRIRYTPSDVFETFPLPELTQELRELGDELDRYRRDVMLSRDSGLTKAYNLVFDPECTDSGIAELRRIHREIDEATVRTYGWQDRIDAVGGLDHGFHPVGRETRYTIGPAAQREILDSLLELNHERYQRELEHGLHDKKKGSAKKSTPRKSADPEDGQGTLL